MKTIVLSTFKKCFSNFDNIPDFDSEVLELEFGLVSDDEVVNPPLNYVCVSVSVVLQFNPLLRDIFGLGAPLIIDPTVKANKISRFEKVRPS